ncbi:MAG TPA: universal stress protein [Candidatus Binatia bacterium]|nr:universal stress protein [Candidatus Binatia bacterium]
MSGPSASAPSPGTAGPAGGASPSTLLLATDLSPASEAATEQALDLARRLGARLLAVSVIDPGTLRLPGGRFGARIDQVRASREREAQVLVRRGRELGVPVTFLIWQGDPGEVIVEAARSEGVEMIVIGSHGRRGVERALLGSVSDHVVRHAPCPVLVVRSDVERPGAGEDGQRV